MYSTLCRDCRPESPVKSANLRSFGLLVYKCHFLPRFLGVWLVLNCFAYLAQSVTGIMWPQYEDVVGNYSFPVMLGEVAIMLWLIIMGAKERQPLAAAAV